jgi:hypothetical protein
MMEAVMTRIKVNVGFKAGVGYVSEASPGVGRSLTALSLMVLRKKLLAVALQRRKAGEEVAVTLLLDSAAEREWNRRRAAAGL